MMPSTNLFFSNSSDVRQILDQPMVQVRLDLLYPHPRDREATDKMLPRDETKREAITSARQDS